MMFLCHLYPRVRRVTADQLYITLMTFDDIIEDETVSEQVTLILSEAVWLVVLLSWHMSGLRTQ